MGRTRLPNLPRWAFWVSPRRTRLHAPESRLTEVSHESLSFKNPASGGVFFGLPYVQTVGIASARRGQATALTGTDFARLLPVVLCICHGIGARPRRFATARHRQHRRVGMLRVANWSKRIVLAGLLLSDRRRVVRRIGRKCAIHRVSRVFAHRHDRPAGGRWSQELRYVRNVRRASNGALGHRDTVRRFLCGRLSDGHLRSGPARSRSVANQCPVRRTADLRRRPAGCGTSPWS